MRVSVKPGTIALRRLDGDAINVVIKAGIEGFVVAAVQTIEIMLRVKIAISHQESVCSPPCDVQKAHGAAQEKNAGAIPCNGPKVIRAITLSHAQWSSVNLVEALASRIAGIQSLLANNVG